VIGTFGAGTVRVPRARLVREEGGTVEWRSKALRRHPRLTKRAEALIAGTYLAGTNTRRVRRALVSLFDGAAGKNVVSRAWRKIRTDWQAWSGRDLHDEDIVRLILDGTVVRVKIDRRATAVSLLAAIGVRRDGETGAAGAQKHGRREHRRLDRFSRGHDGRIRNFVFGRADFTMIRPLPA
jgi:putative transposase